MKIIIDKNELKKNLSICANSVGKINLASPIDGVLFSASTNQLKIITYDYDTAIMCDVGCSIVEPGEALIPFKLLNDIVVKCDGEIVIDSDISKITITNGAAHYELVAQSVDSFPELPSLPENKDSVTIPFGVFYNGVKKVEKFIVYSNDVQQKNPLLNTVQIKISNGVATFVATDGYRMAKHTTNIVGIKSFEIYLNRKVMKICLDVDESDVKIVKGPRHNMISIGNVTIVSRSYSGEYLNHDSIFGASTRYTGKIAVKPFRDAVNLVAPVVVDSSKTPVKLNFSENGVLMLEMSTTLGNSSTCCNMKEKMVDLNGNPFLNTTGMNIRYLSDTLSVCSDDNVVIRQDSPVSPLMIEEKDTSYVLMPMRIKH